MKSILHLSKKGPAKQTYSSVMQMAKSADQGEEWKERWIVTAMEYFHDKKVSKKALRQQTIEHSGDGVRVSMKGVSYWLPIA